MRNISGFKELIRFPKKIVITTHSNPDADALGSSLGLYHLLVQMGHEVYVITPTDYPDFLQWMPGQDKVLIFEGKDFERSTQLIKEAEVIFCLDFSGLSRIKKMQGPVAEAGATKVLIDHHLDPEDFADFTMWDTTAAATAELVYDLIVQLEMKDQITVEMAELIYAGIMTDTGSFKHPSTTAKVHRTVADLIDLGADVNKVNRSIYDTNSLNRLRFMGYAFLKKLVVIPERGIAYFVISAEDFKRFELKSGDTEGLVNYALSLRGIVMATIIIEREDEVKLSFRSVGDFAVNTFANQHFNGGGHKNASGGASHVSLQETVEKFEELTKSFKEEYLIK
ncbi:MAG: bifunctional oligoribonuclease/PAP phosphatase NrnA [Bacteroidota bacterium]